MSRETKEERKEGKKHGRKKLKPLRAEKRRRKEKFRKATGESIEE